ncbi:response regulator transcription factor [Intestinibacillus sp. Marseille-P6563]|mgnify:FL=1|uniref:response regulator transcription factor n=1 Tax=Intestinibacillus sp. Marseille-P6563 TaxID=2364792 RepID=UPI000F05CD7C|nr:response regulator transcription factor [Intestinibacillus sp. Marseille-P6563]
MAVILIADDEARIRRLVSDFLKRDGHTMLEAEDGTMALELLRQHNEIDLAILDVMMPGADGFAVLKSIRQDERTRRLPVMMLTARAEELDQLHGLQGGADDYVTKPFSPLVLCARVKNLLARAIGPQQEQADSFGELDIDEARHEVRVHGADIGLTPKEYELMVYFKNNRGIALSREKILNAVWGYDYFGDLRTVDTHIKKLRAKLGEYGSKIETVRGYGYRFEI